MGIYYPKRIREFEMSGTRERFKAGPGTSLPYVDIRWGRGGIEEVDVFISHQARDTDTARGIAKSLQDFGLDSYLDVEDEAIIADTPELEVRLRSIIAESTTLLAVMTAHTKESWWVPFEIGAARQADCLLASYVDRSSFGHRELPSYLKRWPVVSSTSGLRVWAQDILSYGDKKYNRRDVMDYLSLRHAW